MANSIKIPDICKNSVLLSVVIYNQLLAFVLLLLIEPGWSLENYGNYSIYLQWLSLPLLFLLCKSRAWLNRQNPATLITVCLFSFIVVFASLEGGMALVVTSFLLEPVYDVSAVFRRFLASLILLLILLRVIGLLGVLERRNQSESVSRMEALQARIRPHFLFNSLNTISELAHTDPAQAEQAVNSLALLFRASLESEKKFHSLKDELGLCERYTELERWRLDTRLHITWNILVKRTSAWKVPRLILQPLIENAIVHGVTQDGSVHIDVDVRETQGHLSVLIENQLGFQTVNEGNGIAVDNIRERLFVLYDDRQTFRVKTTDKKYSVIMRFPKQRSTRVA